MSKCREHGPWHGLVDIVDLDLVGGDDRWGLIGLDRVGTSHAFGMQDNEG